MKNYKFVFTLLSVALALFASLAHAKIDQGVYQALVQNGPSHARYGAIHALRKYFEAHGFKEDSAEAWGLMIRQVYADSRSSDLDLVKAADECLYVLERELLSGLYVSYLPELERIMTIIKVSGFPGKAEGLVDKLADIVVGNRSDKYGRVEPLYVEALAATGVERSAAQFALFHALNTLNPKETQSVAYRILSTQVKELTSMGAHSLLQAAVNVEVSHSNQGAFRRTFPSRLLVQFVEAGETELGKEAMVRLPDVIAKSKYGRSELSWAQNKISVAMCAQAAAKGK